MICCFTWSGCDSEVEKIEGRLIRPFKKEMIKRLHLAHVLGRSAFLVLSVRNLRQSSQMILPTITTIDFLTIARRARCTPPSRNLSKGTPTMISLLAESGSGVLSCRHRLTTKRSMHTINCTIPIYWRMLIGSLLVI
ncbi:hypothetical protein HanPSC8_Chr03g0098611 [Helianthus annuus]|nr:hypothetical protein HanPSC8_Chr03g0098611 [Helianthus annuus]